MKTVKTFYAHIFLGLKDLDAEFVYPIEDVKSICQSFCDEVGLCVTITPTEFVYTNGNENGCIVGLINYPRFPNTELNIRETAIKLGTKLLFLFNQKRLSIEFPDETVMLSDEE